MTPVWQLATSSVGLVAVSGPRGVNVLACEWSYFVNKDPVYVAVVLGPRTASRDLIEAAERFAVTFCADDQAAVADFVGSCSVADVDKSTSAALTFGAGECAPWVTGGVLAVECELRQIVPMPVHTMYVGEVVAAHLPDTPRRPLVKHGAMYTLGVPVERTQVVAATRRLDDVRVRVAATAPAGAGTWRVNGADAGTGNARGGLLADVLLPTGATRVVVERGTAEPGHAAVYG